MQAKKIVDFLLQTLEAEDSAPVQAVLCVGLSKLILSGMITDPRVRVSLTITYISPYLNIVIGLGVSGLDLCVSDYNY